MLGVIVNESEILKNILENNNIGDKPMVAINLLVKYHYLKGERDKDIICENIIKTMQKCDCEFRRSKWEDTIRKAIKTFLNNIKKYSTDVKFIDIESVIVTKDELSSIEKLGSKKLKKISFILLVYAKISNIILNRKDGWINQSISNIFKEAKVTAKGKDKPLLLHELLKVGYITTSSKVDKTSLKINYLNEESEVGLIVDDFDGVIYKYLNYAGEKWKRCECCNDWIKGNKKNNNKFCNKCKKAKKLEKGRERFNKWYKNNNSNGS